MAFQKIKSFAKINLALNVLGKLSKMHKIESLVAFIDLNDLIYIKKINLDKHQIKFYGKFSYGIKKKNTISNLLKILADRQILKDQKFEIRIKKKYSFQSRFRRWLNECCYNIKIFYRKKNY